MRDVRPNLPALPRGSVVVIDYTPYHSVLLNLVFMFDGILTNLDIVGVIPLLIAHTRKKGLCLIACPSCLPSKHVPLTI